MLAALSISSAQAVSAQPSTALPRVQYEAPAACPARGEFIERMRARLLADGTRVPAGISLRVTLAEHPAGTHGTVAIARGATKTQRSVDAARCDEVVEALALITALALREHDAGRTATRVRKADKANEAAPSPASIASRADSEARGNTPRAFEPGQQIAGRADGRLQKEGAATPASHPSERARQPTDATARDRAEGAATPASHPSERARQPADATAREGAATQARPRPEAAGAHASEGARQPPDATVRDRAEGAATQARPRPEAADAHASEAARQPADATVRGGSASARAPAAESGATSRVKIQQADGEKASKLGEEAAAEPAKSPSAASTLAIEPWRLGGGIGASFLVFSGTSPVLQPGLQLQAAFSLRSEAVAWSLELGARMARSAGIAAGSGEARFRFAGGVVRLCARRVLGRLALSGCAVTEPGVFSVSGENTLNGRSHSRLWLASGAAADLSVRVTEWLILRAGAELLAPFRRDRVLLGRDTLYRVPLLGVRLHLGLEVPFG